ncbi:MAG: 4Fe-4S dicluster domain-containing protein [Desulfomonile tiedjei]|uniref:4Fe-4S dicluster domain-containing protein n=1 Tax=Desulfomonile tiedjei TaxID=2358 RepID=A0A9D6V016_9BACT|nr:4Fe-4S dicluster domain-containing protein [Desulfomonile tiedjei]
MTEMYTRNKPKNMLLVDASLCIGCLSCQTACQMEHDLPACCRTVRIVQLGPFHQGEDLTMSFLPTTCFHCDRPACVEACPTGAMQKRSDGIVFSDPEICIGCQTCAVACPYGIPTLNRANGKIAKCNGCKDRIDLGLWPVCALKCPTEALVFGRSTRVVQDKRQREALKLARAL